MRTLRRQNNIESVISDFHNLSRIGVNVEFRTLHYPWLVLGFKVVWQEQGESKILVSEEQYLGTKVSLSNTKPVSNLAN